MRTLILSLLMLSVAGATEPLAKPETKLVPIRPEYTAAAFTIHDAREKYAESICRVVATEGNAINYGTGIYIGNRMVISARHVTENLDTVCQFRNEQVTVVDRYSDKYYDCIALVLERDPAVPAVKIAHQEPTGKVVLAGFDHGRPDRLRIYQGVVSQRQHFVDTAMRFPLLTILPHQSGLAVDGNSGGPVFNDDGELVSNLHSVSATDTSANTNGQLRSFLSRIAQKRGLTQKKQTQQLIYDWGSPQQQQPYQPYCQPCQPNQPSPAPSPQPIPPDQRCPPCPPCPNCTGGNGEPNADECAEAVIAWILANKEQFRGPAGEQGQPGETGEMGLTGPAGPAGEAGKIDISALSEEDIAYLASRLPPIYMRRVDGQTGKLLRADPIYLGEGWTFRETPGVTRYAQ